jgi:hypothetical protein
MGVIVATWSFADCAPDLAKVWRGLTTVTGLTIEQDSADSLRIPELRESLFDWVFTGPNVTVHGFVPAHPYVWENLDAVMTAAGGKLVHADHLWRPNAAHARLRKPWRELSGRDRALLRLPSLAGWRPFDRYLR